MKLVVAILGSFQPPFPQIVAEIRRTWAAKPFPEDVDVVTYWPRRSDEQRSTEEECGDVFAPHLDPQILPKTISTFEHLLSTRRPEYIFRCCAGSYVDLVETKRYLADKPKTGFYSGIVGEFGHEFASGSGYFVSADLAKAIVDNRNAMNMNVGTGDDVEVGRLLARRGVRIHRSATRCDVERDEDIKPGYYHYHFRTQVDKFQKIHEIVTASRSPK